MQDQNSCTEHRKVCDKAVSELYVLLLVCLGPKQSAGASLHVVRTHAPLPVSSNTKALYASVGPVVELCALQAQLTTEACGNLQT